MLCIRPFKAGKMEFGCGQCMPCRINKRRQWTARLLLESQHHAASSFVTLTYRDEFRDLKPRDLKLFLMRFRSARSLPFRYFAVGEYGEKSWRPHYHLALFGVSVLEEELIAKSWGLGFIHVGDLTAHSAGYICGYVCKKLTVAGEERLDGRVPEFTRQSLKPGIGAGPKDVAIKAIAAGLTSEAGSLALAGCLDVPAEIRVEGRKFPMGRYLRRKLRTEVGWSPDQPIGAKLEMEAALAAEPVEARELRREAEYDSAWSRIKIARSKRRV